jgi:hypothetical protein
MAAVADHPRNVQKRRRRMGDLCLNAQSGRREDQMDTRAVIEDIRHVLKEVKSNGKETVDISELLEFLKALEADASTSVEYAKMQQQRELAAKDFQFKNDLAIADATNKANLEIAKWVVDTGRDAIQALMVVAGGGVIALLGFLGAMTSRGNADPALGLSITLALSTFGMAAATAAIGFGVRALSQLAFAHEKDTGGHVLTAVCIAVCLIGYVCVGAGVYQAGNAFERHFKSPPLTPPAASAKPPTASSP